MALFLQNRRVGRDGVVGAAIGTTALQQRQRVARYESPPLVYREVATVAVPPAAWTMTSAWSPDDDDDEDDWASDVGVYNSERSNWNGSDTDEFTEDCSEYTDTFSDWCHDCDTELAFSD